MNTLLCLSLLVLGIVFAERLAAWIDRFARRHPFLRNIAEDQRGINAGTLRLVLGTYLLLAIVFFGLLESSDIG